MLGLKATSQVWNGRAEWYLWLDHAPGVYALSFIVGHDLHLAGRRLHEGFFTVKCYPYRSHDDFTGYAPEERRLIESDWFDTTNTPRFEAQQQIPDSLFWIGGFSMVIDPQDDLALMTFESLDALKLHQRRETSGGEADTPAPFLVRNVAGWKTGALLFDCLVGLHANTCKQPPIFAGATCSPGFESILSPENVVDCRPSQDCRHMALSIGFDPSADAVGTIDAIWRMRLDPEETILAATPLPDTASALAGRLFPKDLAINPLWWDIAHSNFRSELNTACGCADGHCQHR
ncbi:MAG: hypothetical protein JRF23_02960 [Deltaproteobacteria bacterium]|nr:hypothetical protein [Deltaproteobacteria bacterium]